MESVYPLPYKAAQPRESGKNQDLGYKRQGGYPVGRQAGADTMVWRRGNTPAGSTGTGEGIKERDKAVSSENSVF